MVVAMVVMVMPDGADGSNKAAAARFRDRVDNFWTTSGHCLWTMKKAAVQKVIH